MNRSRTVINGWIYFCAWKNDKNHVFMGNSEGLDFWHSLAGHLWHSPHRLVMLKAFRPVDGEWKVLRKRFKEAEAGVTGWYHATPLLMAYLREEAPCDTELAKETIGTISGRLLWRPTDEEQSGPVKKQRLPKVDDWILQAIAARKDRGGVTPATLIKACTFVQKQTIYNSLHRLFREGWLSKPKRGYYGLTFDGYERLQGKSPRSRKSVRSLRP
jgi:hypothetical protein